MPPWALGVSIPFDAQGCSRCPSGALPADELSFISAEATAGRGSRLEEAVELGEGVRGILADQNRVHPEGPGRLDVPRKVVEEDGSVRAGDAEPREREPEDLPSGLPAAHLGGVDDGVEDLFEGKSPTPVVAELGDVVRHHRGAEAVALQAAGVLDDFLFEY